MKFEHTLQIAAPVSVVWEVSTDVERWPEWHPLISNIERVDKGDFQVGSSARIKQSGLPDTKWTVTTLTPGKQFSWETKVLGMHMIGSHELSATDTGTENVLKVEVTGFVTWLLWPMLWSSLPWALNQENTGLKSRCEGTA